VDEHHSSVYIAQILANVKPGAAVPAPPPAGIDAIAGEYSEAKPDAFEPIDPAALAGPAREAYDGAEPSPVEAYVWKRSSPLYEVRITLTGTSGRPLKQSYLYDASFTYIVGVSEVEDADAPDGVRTLVLDPNDDVMAH
jgi:hypothetical protein